MLVPGGGRGGLNPALPGKVPLQDLASHCYSAVCGTLAGLCETICAHSQTPAATCAKCTEESEGITPLLPLLWPFSLTDQRRLAGLAVLV